jgi:hypothetical protein
MADGFIVRKGGAVTEQALAPTITEVSVTGTSITFTITNNDASTAVILYEVDDATPDENSIELAAAATSSNITVTGLSEDVEYDVYATANVTGKVKSNVTSLAITTLAPIVYTAATGGTTAEYDSGGSRFKSHTFTSNGTFEVTTVGDATGDRNKVDYLIIAGGGGGGGVIGGGGGAGGYRTTLGTSGAESSAESKVTVSVASYGVTIGLGGAGGTSTNDGSNGQNTSVSFPSTITSSGGGGGGGAAARVGISGGSGGGAAHRISNGTTAGGTGTSAQGRNGGSAIYSSASDIDAGGGGGAKDVGQNNTSGTKAGNGGDGLANLLRTGSNETRAGGGGGAGLNGQGLGGAGGGGNGLERPSTNNTAGAANTGGGGGGGDSDPIHANTPGKAGGSGIVIIRYEIAPTT